MSQAEVNITATRNRPLPISQDGAAGTSSIRHFQVANGWLSTSTFKADAGVPEAQWSSFKLLSYGIPQFGYVWQDSNPAAARDCNNKITVAGQAASQIGQATTGIFFTTETSTNVWPTTATSLGLPPGVSVTGVERRRPRRPPHDRRWWCRGEDVLVRRQRHHPRGTTTTPNPGLLLPRRPRLRLPGRHPPTSQRIELVPAGRLTPPFTSSPIGVPLMTRTRPLLRAALGTLMSTVLALSIASPALSQTLPGPQPTFTGAIRENYRYLSTDTIDAQGIDCPYQGSIGTNPGQVVAIPGETRGFPVSRDNVLVGDLTVVDGEVVYTPFPTDFDLAITQVDPDGSWQAQLSLYQSAGFGVDRFLLGLCTSMLTVGIDGLIDNASVANAIFESPINFQVNTPPVRGTDPSPTTTTTTTRTIPIVQPAFTG